MHANTDCNAHSHCDVCKGCVPQLHGANVVCSDACLKELRRRNRAWRKANGFA